MKKVFGLSVAIILCLGILLPLSIANANILNIEKNRVLTQAEERVLQAVQVYRLHHSDAKIDIDQFLQEAKQIDANTADCWSEIMNWWMAMNDNPNYVNTGLAPATLPNDNTLAFFVLGCGVKDDGTPGDELKGRLDTAYKSWVLHSNAYIGVSGGHTNPKAPVTEGECMRNYLVDTYNVPESQIIVEDKAGDTIDNCQFFYKIITEQYPSINQICLVTSDYHINRGSILWMSKTIGASKLPDLYNDGVNGKYIPLVANTAYDTQYKTHESISGQGIGVERSMFIRDFSTKVPAICPSEVKSIELSELKCPVGQAFKPQTIGHFLRDEDKTEEIPINLHFVKENCNAFPVFNFVNQKIFNFDRNITDFCEIDCDTSTTGIKNCKVTLNYCGSIFTSNFDVEVFDPNVTPTNPEVVNTSTNAETYTSPSTFDSNSVLIVAIAMLTVLSSCVAIKKLKY